MLLATKLGVRLTGRFERGADGPSNTFLDKNNLEPEVAAVPNSVVGNAALSGE